MVKCQWCGKEVEIDDWSNHIDSHKDVEYDRKLIRESKSRHVQPPEGVEDQEMMFFVQCVAEKLTVLPKPGEYPSGPTGVIARLLEQRIVYEHSLYSVLLGEKTLQDFFSQATQRWDVNKQKISKIIYDCLETLHGTEARKVKKQWEQYLRYF